MNKYKNRHRGIGSRLMDLAEQIAFSYSDVIYLGVGLHSGYGSAQRYDCSAIIHGINREFTLLYHPGENTWDMILDNV